MKPIIYKTGAYNTPGIYKGTGGIYKGRGIYNDGATPPGPVPQEHLILCEYFDKRVGAQLTGGTINNFGYDNTCPLNIPGGAPYSKNTEHTNLYYEGLNTNSDIILSKTFTIEFFLKVNSLTGASGSSPTAIIGNTGDTWIAAICPNSNNSNSVKFWHNDSPTDISILNSLDWHHYEISVDNGLAYFFIDGNFFYSWDITGNLNNTAYFNIQQIRSGRCEFSISQVAVWDICKHTNNFSVDYEPIAY